MCIRDSLRADIFTICLPFKNKKQLSDIAVALHEKICAYPLFCKALPAFGICISKNHMDISLMCDYADMALQKIKGKAYAIYEFYDDKMRKEMMREKRIENNVAMALRDEEFKVYIQPKVDMRSGEIIGGEALIRWHSVKEGIIYPDEFIPVLEKSGYIVDVDAYVWAVSYTHLTTQIGLIDGEFVVNPSQTQWQEGDLQLTVASTRQKVIMIEAGANEIPEAKMIEAIYMAHDINQTIIEFIDKIVAEVGKEKHTYVSCAVPAEMFEAMKQIVTPQEMEEAVFTDDKQTRCV